MAGRRRVALLGHPVSHSRSPAMQNAAFRAVGSDWSYEAIDVPPGEVGRTVRRLREEGWAGANVTIPHKVAAAALCDVLTDGAAATGAVNTLVFGPEGVLGANTDIAGFEASVIEDLDMDLEGARVVVLGRGGAARAVEHAARTAGAASFERVHRETPPAEARAHLEAADLVVNATPLGWRDEPPPFDVSWLKETAAVLDLVYGKETPLLRLARGRGLRAADGTTMLVEQAAAAFTLWTGREAPREAMRRAFEEAGRR